MNRIHQRAPIVRLRPRTTVISGAALGILAGAAVYGAISSSASAATPTVVKAANASRAAARVNTARCAAGKLEHGLCIVHVVRTVVVPAASSPTSASSGQDG